MELILNGKELAVRTIPESEPESKPISRCAQITHAQNFCNDLRRNNTIHAATSRPLPI